MNRNADFEERLLIQLQAFVAERGAAGASSEKAKTGDIAPAWRRGPRLALAGAFALAAVLAGLIVGAGGDGTPSAFAIEPQDNGAVAIKIYSLSDASGLESALGEAGIPSQVTYLPTGMTCREPHFKPSTVNIPEADGRFQPFGGFDMSGPGDPMTIGIGNLQQRQELSQSNYRGDSSAAEVPNFMIDPTAFKPDQTLILFGSPAPYDGDPEGGSVAHVRIAEGEVGACEPVPAPHGSGPIRYLPAPSADDAGRR